MQTSVPSCSADSSRYFEGYTSLAEAPGVGMQQSASDFTPPVLMNA